MSCNTVSDSQSDVTDTEDINWDFVRNLEGEKASKLARRQIFVAKSLKPLTKQFADLPMGKTRRREFDQRHVYLTDLAQFLELTSKTYLNNMSKNNISDEEIIYMLNRKYTKLRRFYEKHNVRKHRFKKKNLSLYLEYFKKRTNTNSIYDLVDDKLPSVEEKNELNYITNTTLEDIVTTDEETGNESADKNDSENDDNAQVPSLEMQNPNFINNSIQNKLAKNKNSFNSSAKLNNQYQSIDVPINNDDKRLSTNNLNSDNLRYFSYKSDEDLGQQVGIMRKNTEDDEVINDKNDSQPNVVTDFELLLKDSISDLSETNSINPKQVVDVIHVNSQTSESQCPHFHNNRGALEAQNNISEAIHDFNAINSSPELPIPPEITNEVVSALDADPYHSFALPEMARRTRRHKFSQDHLYLTDTAAYLGLSTEYQLNAMSDEGKSYSEIVSYLEKIYQKIRQERRKKEIGYGPYAKPSFTDCFDAQRKRIQNESVNEIRSSNIEEDDEDSQMKAFVEDDNLFSSDEEFNIPESEQSNLLKELGKVNDSGIIKNSDYLDYGDSFNHEVVVPKATVKNKKSLLHGVLPNSYLTVNEKQISQENRLYQIKRQNNYLKNKNTRKTKSGGADKEGNANSMREFLASDNEAGSYQESSIVSYNRFDNRNMRENYSLDIKSAEVGEYDEISDINDCTEPIVFSEAEDLEDENDDDRKSNYFGTQISSVRGNIDMNGSAVEDDSGFIDPMVQSNQRNLTKNIRKRQVLSTCRASRVKRGHISAPRKRSLFTSSEVDSLQHLAKKKKFQTQLDVFSNGLKRYEYNMADSNVPLNHNMTWLSDDENQVLTTPKLAGRINEVETKSNPLMERDSKFNVIKGRQVDKIGKHKKPATLINATEVKVKKKKNSNGIIAASYAPVGSPNFSFGRKRISGTIQLEGTSTLLIKQPLTLQNATEFDINAAKSTSYLRKGFETDNEDINMGNNLEPVAEAQVVDLIGDKSISQLTKAWLENLDIRDLFLRKFKCLQILKPSDYEQLKPPQKSILDSFLIRESLKLEGEYYINKRLTFEFNGISFFLIFPLRSFESVAQNMSALLNAVLLYFKGLKAFSYGAVMALRKCFIKIIQLLWNLKKDSFHSLKVVGKLLLKFVKDFRFVVSNKRAIILFLPYLLNYLNLLHKFLRNKNDFDYKRYEKMVISLEKKFLKDVCKFSFEKIFMSVDNKKNITAWFLESISLFTLFSKNPWSYIASISRKSKLDILDVTNFLFFINTRKPVLVDWEFYIQELDDLQTEKNINATKASLAIIMKIVKDLKWELEEQLLVKVYRLLSYRRFENMGYSGFSNICHYPTIPATFTIAPEDGCLDIYFKMLALYVNKYMDITRSRSLIEKLVPIGSLANYDCKSLQNRSKVLIIMTYLFERDFLDYIKPILKALASWSATESSTIGLSLILAVSRCHTTVFGKLPFVVIKKYLPPFIERINRMVLDENIARLTSIFKHLVEFLKEAFIGCTVDDLKFNQMLSTVSIFLKLRKYNSGSEMEAIPVSGLAMLSDSLISVSDDTVNVCRRKIEEAIIPSLKKVILAKGMSNINLSIDCLKLWVWLSAKLNISCHGLYYMQWQYFGSEPLRKKLELAFFAEILKRYTPHDYEHLELDILSTFYESLSKYEVTSFYDLFFSLLGSPFIANILPSKTKLNVNNLTKSDFRKNKTVIALECMRKLIINIRDASDKNSNAYLNFFLKSLKKEIDIQKVGDYRKFAIRITAYLYSIAKDVIQTPEWHFIVHELKITEIIDTLPEKLENVSTVPELVIVLESEYIQYLSTKSFEQFKSELLQIVDVTSTEPEKNLIFPISIVIAIHVQLIIEKEEYFYWYHIYSWFKILKEVLYMRLFIDESIVSPLIKLLVHVSKLSTRYLQSHQYFFYVYNTTSLIYQIIRKIGNALVGYDDFSDFVSSLTLFAAIDPSIGNEIPIPVDTHLSFFEPTLRDQIYDMLKEKGLILASQIEVPDDVQLIDSCKENKQKEKEYTLKYMGCVSDERETPDEYSVWGGPDTDLW